MVEPLRDPEVRLPACGIHHESVHSLVSLLERRIDFDSICSRIVARLGENRQRHPLFLLVLLTIMTEETVFDESPAG